MASFDLPVGPLADLHELLYVTALQQACSTLRKDDASITPDDVSIFLCSRYGVKMTPQAVEEFILKDMSITNTTATYDDDMKSSLHLDTTRELEEDLQGIPSLTMNGSNKSNDCKLDLVELVSLLFIPQLLKQLQENKDIQDLVDVCRDSFSFVTDCIKHDVSTFGDKNHKHLDHEELSATRLELTHGLIRDMFLSYGETALAHNDDLIEEMLQAVVSHGDGEEEKVYFDAQTFVQAVTHDIGIYNIRREARISTNWNDVFGDDDEDDPVVGDTCSNTTTSTASSIRNSKKKQPTLQQEQQPQQPSNFTVHQTAGPIDMVAHTYVCRIQMVMNWLFFVFTLFAYLYLEVPAISQNCPEFTVLSTWQDSKSMAGCSIGLSIVDWLVSFALVCVAGFMFVGLGAFGNDLKQNKWIPTFFTMLFLLFLTVFFPLEFGFGTSKPLIFLRIVSLVFGIFATALRMRMLVYFCRGSEESALFPYIALHNDSFSKQASAFKVANIQKNAIEVHETLTKDSAIRSYFGNALTNFSKVNLTFAPNRCTYGDFYGRARNNKILTEDGMFFSGRHIAGNVAQWILCIFILGNGVVWTKRIGDAWIPKEEQNDQVAASLEFVVTLAANQLIVQGAVESIIQSMILFVLRVLYFLYNAGLLRLDCILLGNFLDSFCQKAFFDDEDDGDFACTLFAGGPEALCRTLDPFFRPSSATGNPPSVEDMVAMINATDLVAPVKAVVSRAVSDNLTEQLNQLYPKHRFMVVAPVAVGTVAAFLCAVSIAFSLLPSVTATTLKLRSGALKSVTDTDRRVAYLGNVNKGTYLFGSMFWGILASSLLIGFLVGAVVFFFAWQVTAFMAAYLLALGIGIGVCLALKWIFTRACRVNLYQGLYRRHPLRANVIELLNESFNFATSIAFAIVRMVKLLFLAAYYVGRIDARFLERSVGRYFDDWVIVDNYPNYFISDILSTEAHRHPYIESLGVVYLYKLKYGDAFITRAGSAWRLLFVTALMPWLQKYRFESKGKGCIPALKEEIQSRDEELGSA